MSHVLFLSPVLLQNATLPQKDGDNGKNTVVAKLISAFAGKRNPSILGHPVVMSDIRPLLQFYVIWRSMEQRPLKRICYLDEKPFLSGPILWNFQFLSSLAFHPQTSFHAFLAFLWNHFGFLKFSTTTWPKFFRTQTIHRCPRHLHHIPILNFYCKVISSLLHWHQMICRAPKSSRTLGENDGTLPRLQNCQIVAQHPKSSLLWEISLGLCIDSLMLIK